jgi:Ca2+-binding RTX toxin-like protein
VASGTSAASAQGPTADPADAAATDPLVWTDDRPRLADDERWVDVLATPSGVLAIGRNVEGAFVSRRQAPGSWRTAPFAAAKGRAAAHGPSDGPTHLVEIDDRVLAVGTVGGRLAAWSLRPVGWTRAPETRKMGLPPGRWRTPALSRVGWVASDGERVVITGSAMCPDCRSSTWTSDDGVAWQRREVLIDGRPLVAVFSGRDRVLGVTIPWVDDTDPDGVLVASTEPGRWRALGSLPLPWTEDVLLADTGEQLIVIGRDGTGRLRAWRSVDGRAWSLAWAAEDDSATGLVLTDIATLGPSVLVIGSVAGDATASGWSLWSPDAVTWRVTSDDLASGCPTAVALTASEAVAVGGGCEGTRLAWRATLPGPVRCDGLIPTLEADADGGTTIGTPGDDVILGSGAEDRIDGGAGDDVICGGAGHDVLIGGPGDDTLLGEDGTDDLRPGPGDDVVDGGRGLYDSVSYRDAPGQVDANLVKGVVRGQGVDRVIGIEHLIGSARADRIVASRETRVLEGRGGDDVLIGSPWSESLDGGNGRDRILGGAGADELDGGSGMDVLSGGAGKDMLVGGDGTDLLRGGPGEDLLFGDQTHDCAEDCSFPFLVLADRLDGGPGRDTCLDGRRTRCEVDR